MVEYIPAEFEVLDRRFAGTGGDRSVARLFPAVDGSKDPPTTQQDASCCSATSPTTGCCVTTR